MSSSRVTRNPGYGLSGEELAGVLRAYASESRSYPRRGNRFPQGRLREVARELLKLEEGRKDLLRPFYVAGRDLKALLAAVQAYIPRTIMSKSLSRRLPCYSGSRQPRPRPPLPGKSDSHYVLAASMNRSKRSLFDLHMGHTSGGCSLAQR